MNEIVNQIKPSREQQKTFEKTAKEFCAKLNKNLTKAKAVLGGSGAKDTWLAEQHDIDVFVAFEYNHYVLQSHTLSNILEPIIKKTFSTEIERLHGSRDYFQLQYEGYTFEIVPILNIAEADQAQNITDVSLLHANWVNSNGKKLKDDIRLLKQFCKANRLYGAESYIAGFSGYIVEILTIFYGSFQEVLKASLKWKPKQTIDPAEYYKGKDIFFELNKSKLNSPLIIIDPVDKNRNAAAALSKEKFDLFKETAKQYLKNPSTESFTKQEFTKENLQKPNTHLVYLTLKPKEGKKDVVGAKLLKVFNHLHKALTPFTVLDANWEFADETILYFLLEKNELPSTSIQQGPPLKMAEAVEKFKAKHPKTFQEDEHIKAEISAQYPKLEDYLKNELQHPYIKERTAKIISTQIS